MDAKTVRSRLGSAARRAFPAVVLIGSTTWVCHLLHSSDRRRPDDRLKQVARALVDTHDRLTRAVDGRLRSLEETVSRSEAEVRFMATLVGDRRWPEPQATESEHPEVPLTLALRAAAERLMASEACPGDTTARAAALVLQGRLGSWLDHGVESDAGPDPSGPLASRSG